MSLITEAEMDRIDVNAIPASPSSEGWEVPKTTIIHQCDAGCVTKMSSTLTTTELGTAIRSVSMQLRKMMLENPSLDAVQTFLARWKGPTSDKIQPMVFAWFDNFRILEPALEHNRVDLVKFLLEQGFTIEGSDVAIALEQLKKTEDPTIFELLLEYGWDINARTRPNTQPALAYVTRSEALVRNFLARGADPNGASARNCTVLHSAATIASIPTIRLLLDKGGDISPSSLSSGIIAHAVEEHSDTNDRLPVIKYLLGQGADINGIYMQPLKLHDGHQTAGFNPGHQTALHMAVRQGKRDLVEFLLKHGADTKGKTWSRATSYKEMTVVELAKKTKHDDLIKLLEGVDRER